MSHTPNTPANGGQILTWQERMGKHYSAAGRVDIHPFEYFKDAEIADLRAALAAPAIPTVDRNAAPSGDVLRAIVRSASTSATDGASPQEYVIAGWNAALKSTAPASVPQPAAQGAAQKPDAWLIPCLLTFDGKHTSCPADLIPELEGTVAWGVELFSDGDGVTDKNGVQHKPRPLFAAPATDKTAEGL